MIKGRRILIIITVRSYLLGCGTSLLLLLIFPFIFSFLYPLPIICIFSDFETVFSKRMKMFLLIFSQCKVSDDEWFLTWKYSSLSTFFFFFIIIMVFIEVPNALDRIGFAPQESSIGWNPWERTALLEERVLCKNKFELVLFLSQSPTINILISQFQF